MNLNRLRLLAFDADDTLWCCEKFFRKAEERFAALFSVPPEVSITRYRQIAAEALPARGYGIKSSLAAMLDCGTELNGGSLPEHIAEKIFVLNDELANHPVELRPGTEKVISLLAQKYPLLIITKGRREEQERKLEASGLRKYFTAMEVFQEKTQAAYKKILTRQNIAAESFLMTGDSLSCDIAPVKALGGKAFFLRGTQHWQPDICHCVPDAEITELEEIIPLLFQ